MKPFLILIPLCGVACFARIPAPPPLPAYDAAAIQAQVAEGTDASALAQVKASRRAAASGGMAEARGFAGSVGGLFTLGTVARGKANGPELLREAEGYLDAASRSVPAEAPEGLSSRGAMYICAQKGADGEKVLRESIDKRPTVEACLSLIAYLDAQEKRGDIATLCKRTLPNAKSDNDRFVLLDACARHSHASSIEAALSWASPKDLTFYRAKRDEVEASNAAYQAKRADDREQQRAAFDASRRERDAHDARSSNCRAQCESHFGTCQAACGSSGSCWNSCAGAKRECAGSCR